MGNTMQTHFFNSKTWQYLTLEELELQAKKDKVPEMVEELLSKKSTSRKKDWYMKWEKPTFNDLRLGFEVTCYIYQK